MINVNEATQLAMAVIPESFLNEVKQELGEVKNLLQKKSEEEVNNQWIESAEVRKMLGVSQKTWQTYRDKRVIPFSQFGSKIYVKRKDINKFMEDHYISSSN